LVPLGSGLGDEFSFARIILTFYQIGIPHVRKNRQVCLDLSHLTADLLYQVQVLLKELCILLLLVLFHGTPLHAVASAGRQGSARPSQ
jgi:hypothetical protein